MNFLLTSIRIILPVLLLAGLVALAFIVKQNPPEAERGNKPKSIAMNVEAIKLERKPYQLKIQSYGTLQPRTQSMLVAQVAGQIISINPSLREGGFFEKGDELLRIDDRDYIADVKIAEASLLNAKQSLAEETARSEQAQRDWDRLGNTGKPSDLVLRKPQLMAAEASLISARSTLSKARLNLERTRIIAPYAGRVLSKKVDVGQVVTINTQLAEVYASDMVEVRLPLRNRDLAFIQLPESYRDDESEAVQGPKVTINSELANQGSWHGHIVRTEGAIDETARQLHVVAQIDDPFSKQEAAKTPLKIGQYVTAELQGESLADALVIPNLAIYQGSYVYIVEEGLLQRREIEISWQNENEAIIHAGINDGDMLVLTSLGQVTSGVPVQYSLLTDHETTESLSMTETEEAAQ